MYNLSYMITDFWCLPCDYQLCNGHNMQLCNGLPRWCTAKRRKILLQLGTLPLLQDHWWQMGINYNSVICLASSKNVLTSVQASAMEWYNIQAILQQGLHGQSQVPKNYARFDWFCYKRQKSRTQVRQDYVYIKLINGKWQLIQRKEEKIHANKFWWRLG